MTTQRTPRPEASADGRKEPPGEPVIRRSVPEPDLPKFPEFPGDAPLAYATQTTLSVDDTADILAALKRRFPELPDPHKEDICYATTNRQEAVKALGQGCELVLVVGSKNSSNSARLVEVALRAGARDARLIDDAGHVDWSWFDGVSTLGITAGASAPEQLIEELIDAVRARFDVRLVEDDGARETVTFKLPRLLTA